MHVLIYVTAILIVLASMTYSRLQSYRSFATLQASYVHFMKNAEHIPMDDLFKEQYDTVRVGSKTKDPDAEKATKAEGTARLSLHLILNREARSKKQLAHIQTRALLKQLMTNLYGKQKFFLELLEKHPHFLDEIIDSLQTAADNAFDKSYPDASYISRLAMPTQDLHYGLYLMLQGLQQDEVKPNEVTGKEFIVREITEDTDDEEEAALNSSDVNAPPGYVSLLNFITPKSPAKIRVFLAPPTLLMAIYNDASLVEKIVEMRTELYKRIRNKEGLAREEATRLFEAAFKNAGTSSSYEEILNYAVTNTEPKTG